MQIGLPFGQEYSTGILEDIDLRINNSSTPIELRVLEYDNSPEWWSLVFDDDYWSRDFIICNITFVEDVYTVLSLTFSTNFEFRRGYIHYDVGTSRAWLTRVNESVEFRITGEQPDSQSEECEISSTDNGYSYIWNWENEHIEAYSVGVYYDTRNWIQRIDYDQKMMILVIGLPASIIFIIVVTAVFKTVRRRKKEPKLISAEELF